MELYNHLKCITVNEHLSVNIVIYNIIIIIILIYISLTMYHFKWASKLRLHRQYPHVLWIHVLCSHSCVVRHSRQRNGLAFVSDVHKLLILLTWIHDWCRDKVTNPRYPLQFAFIVSCNHMICKHVLFEYWSLKCLLLGLLRF